MIDVWQACNGTDNIINLKISGWRSIEDQAKSYTRKLVSNDIEHQILEELLEQTSKPPLQSDLKHLHYLLATPFRYPPLQYGSRFGCVHERSIFYGSLDVRTSLAEKAFYRFKFIAASAANFDNSMVGITSFKFNIHTQAGIDLTKDPFKQYTNEISSKTSYTSSQYLGRQMRELNIAAFIFYSARHAGGKILGVFTPSAFGKNNNLDRSFVHWNCYITKELIEFTPKFAQKFNTIIFRMQDFFTSSID